MAKVKNNMNVVKNKNIFFTISGIIVAAIVALMFVWGIELGIDFTGGSIMEVSFENERPAIEQVENTVESLAIGSFSVRPTGDDAYIIRTRFLEDDEHQALLEALGTEENSVTEERFSSIGPTIGSELKSKALWGLALVIISIVLFIAFAFRKVSEPVSSWRYGGVAIVALVHDILIPTGTFVVLGQFAGAQVDVLFVMALLAILGYSVNDTIVVFDRVRENLRNNHEMNRHEPFDTAVGRSLEQTYTRSINTSVTTLLVLFALLIFGPVSTQFFVVTLIAGVIAGTYSSIFLASPLLVQLQEWQEE